MLIIVMARSRKDPYYLPHRRRRKGGRSREVTLCEKTTVVRVRCTEKWRERERSYFQFPLCGVEIFS